MNKAQTYYQIGCSIAKPKYNLIHCSSAKDKKKTRPLEIYYYNGGSSPVVKVNVFTRECQLTDAMP